MCADTEKTDSERKGTEVRDESKQRMVRFKVTLFGLSWTEKLSHSLVVE